MHLTDDAIENSYSIVTNCFREFSGIFLVVLRREMRNIGLCTSATSILTNSNILNTIFYNIIPSLWLNALHEKWCIQIYINSLAVLCILFISCIILNICWEIHHFNHSNGYKTVFHYIIHQHFPFSLICIGSEDDNKNTRTCVLHYFPNWSIGFRVLSDTGQHPK